MAAETNVIAGEDLGARRRRPLGVRRKGQQPRRPRETHELVAAVQRLLKALGRRAAEEDPEVLLELQGLAAAVQLEIVNAVRAQRLAGVTWEQIGTATRTTRQAAIMKWGPKL